MKVESQYSSRKVIWVWDKVGDMVCMGHSPHGEMALNEKVYHCQSVTKIIDQYRKDRNRKNKQVPCELDAQIQMLRDYMCK